MKRMKFMKDDNSIVMASKVTDSEFFEGYQVHYNWCGRIGCRYYVVVDNEDRGNVVTVLHFPAGTSVSDMAEEEAVKDDFRNLINFHSNKFKKEAATV